ncbi:MAG: hypothetical protein J5808_07830 [Paludibacteraceae bacterium]|nr:hypothetical protein [Paludibacteraceae bacterium]
MKRPFLLAVTALLPCLLWAGNTMYCSQALNSAATAADYFRRALVEKNADNKHYYLEKGSEAADDAVGYCGSCGCNLAQGEADSGNEFGKAAYYGSDPADVEYYLKAAIESLDKVQQYINDCMVSF